MIDTNGMYGNVVEEQDAFQLAQKRREAEIKAAAAKKYAVPGIDSKNAAEAVKDEIVIPEVDENYPENALKVMFDMQESLQNMLGKKRGTLTPDSNENLFIKSGMSIYHLGSVVTELFELDEQMQKDNYEITDLSRFELTDAVHFLMNTLLYVNLKPRETLEFYPALSSVQSCGSSGTPATCRVPGCTRHLSLTIGVLPGEAGEGLILGERTPPAPPGPPQGCGTASGPRFPPRALSPSDAAVTLFLVPRVGCGSRTPQNHIPWQPLGVCFKPYAPAISILENLAWASIKQQELVSVCLSRTLREKSRTLNSTLLLPTLRGLLRLSEG